MRMQTAVLAAAALLVGCAPGADGELRGLVEDVAPAERSMLECNWGKNWGDESGAYYGCIYSVPGKLTGVGQGVLTRLAGRGFTVTCRADRHTIELIGARGGTTFYADILADGFVHGRNVEAADVDVPPNHVIVDVSAFKNADGLQPGRLCADPS